MLTFHTPEIADVLSAPAAQKRIAEINSCLARGIREVGVYPGIAVACAKALRDAGWTVAVAHVDRAEVTLTIRGPFDAGYRSER